MEPKTTGVGQDNLEASAKDIGLTAGSTSGVSHARYSTQARALMPQTGAEIAYAPGLAGALMAGGFVLCIFAAAIRRKR